MTRKPTTSIFRRSLLVAVVATAVAAPAADARLTAGGPDDSHPDGWRQASAPVRPDDRADRSISAGTPKYVYSDGVLRRTDGTPLSAPVVQADPRFVQVDGTVRAIDGTPLSSLLSDGRYVYSDGALRRTDGTPLSSPAVEPREAVAASSPSFDWFDASVGALSGFAAALLIGGALVIGRTRGGARIAHS